MIMLFDKTNLHHFVHKMFVPLSRPMALKVQVKIMDKLKLTGRNLSRAFKSRLGHVCTDHELYTFFKTANLKVETSAQTTFRFSHVGFRAPWLKQILLFLHTLANWQKSIELRVKTKTPSKIDNSNTKERFNFWLTTFWNSPKHSFEGHDLRPVNDPGRDVKLHPGQAVFSLQKLNVVLWNLNRLWGDCSSPGKGRYKSFKTLANLTNQN